VDENDEIAMCANQFFTELSKKKNDLYNALADLISWLSDPEKGVDKVHFRSILKKILSLIDKDKQMEQLVDKLCCRLRLVDSVRQWEDLSYCLMHLHYKCVELEPFLVS
jgi:condensin complex subunit 1